MVATMKNNGNILQQINPIHLKHTFDVGGCNAVDPWRFPLLVAKLFHLVFIAIVQVRHWKVTFRAGVILPGKKFSEMSGVQRKFP